MSSNNSKDEVTDDLFEDTIAKVGFGRYNLFILLTSVPGAMAIIFSSSSMSYVMPRAECDLKLGIKEKCLLNAITYAGMICGSIPWALFSDMRGRQKVVVLAYFLDSFFNFLCSVSQNFGSLLVFKFASGLCICGAYSALMTYIAESHGTKYRPYAILTVGILLSVSSLILPFIAMGVLSQHWSFHHMGIMLPSLMCGSMYLFMPESVKYQMSKGRNSAALHTLKTMYSRNSRQPADQFPIQYLGPEQRRTSVIVHEPKLILHEGWQLISQILSRPYVGHAICIFTVEFVVLCCQNSLRLWLPQVFASLEKNENSNEYNVCKMFEETIEQDSIVNNSPEDCNIIIKASSYLNNVYVNCVSLVAYIFALVVVKFFNGKVVLCLSLFLSSAMAFFAYTLETELHVVAIISGYLAMENVCSTVLVVLAVSLFPTKMRNTVISMSMMIGRIGSLLGNLIISLLMYMNCMYAVLAFGGVGMWGFFISLFIPQAPKHLL